MPVKADGKAPEVAPLLTVEQRHSLVTRAFDAALLAVTRKLQEAPEEVTTATVGELVKLVSSYQRNMADRAEAAIMARAATEDLLHGLPSFPKEKDIPDPILDPASLDEPFKAPEGVN